MSGSSKIPEDILDDLSSRFIINVPKNERTGLNRVSFQIELAHWFYLDYYCVQNPALKPYKLKEFFIYIFQHIPFLKKYEAEIDSIYNKWREYKQLVPTFGAILIDETLSNILLVQSYMASWGFPKGKVNQEEDPVDCACREVFEEIGVDISKLIRPNEYVESTIHDQLIRLYFIVGVSKNATFEPQTMGEIKSVKWFPIEQLPVSKKDIVCKNRSEPRYFYMVIPFMKRIINWIEDTKRRNPVLKYKKLEKPRNKSVSDSDYNSNASKLKKAANSTEKQKISFQSDHSFVSPSYSELNTTEELQQSIENSTTDMKTSGLSKRKIRNFQRVIKHKTKPDNYSDLKSQLDIGSEHWKNFHFNKDRIIEHLY